MKLRLLLLSVIMLSCLFGEAQHFGILSNDSEAKAKSVGVDLLRKSVDIKSPRKGDQSIYNTVYNINYGTYYNTPLPFAKDLKDYRSKLVYQYDLFTRKPLLLIIGNEENNKKYYSGSAEEYIAMLTVAISEFAPRGIQVTNGGLTKPALLILMYETWLAQGSKDKAEELRRYFHLPLKNKDSQKAKEFAKTCLNAYKGLPMDVNIHWYSASIEDNKWFWELSNFIKQYTGKKVITTEMGLYFESGPATTGLVNTCKDFEMPWAIFYANKVYKSGRIASFGLFGANEAAFREAIK